MKNLTKVISTTFALGFLVVHAQEEAQDCSNISAGITSAVSADRGEVLNIITEQLGQSPGCACEGVKSAIQASEADNGLVGSIVEAAITTVPSQADLIADCATAEAPDAAAEIDSAYEKVTGNKRSASGNPLDFPGDVEGGVNGDDLNSGAGIGDGNSLGQGNSFLQVNQGEVDAVTDPGPRASN